MTTQLLLAPTVDANLPCLPPLDGNLLTVHYSQQLLVDSPAQTPAVSAIVVQWVLTGVQQCFACCLVAEQQGSPIQVDCLHRPELEKTILESFFAFVAQHPQAVWLHWAMRQPSFGFDTLIQRARMYQLEPVEILPTRRFDLSSYLKRRFGEDFAPHPRFPNAMLINGYGGLGLLDQTAAASAWERGEHHKLLHSLGVEVDAISDMLERVYRGTFLTAVPLGTEPEQEVEGEKPARVEDDSAYVAASTLQDLIGTYKQFRAYLRRHPEIRSQKPSPKRFKVHAGDFHRVRQAEANAAFSAGDLDPGTTRAFGDEAARTQKGTRRRNAGK